MLQTLRPILQKALFVHLYLSWPSSHSNPHCQYQHHVTSHHLTSPHVTSHT